LRPGPGPDPDSDPSFFPLLFGIFYIHDQVKDRDFNYLLVALRRKVNIKLFLVVFPHIVLFKFEVKYKPGLKENLDMDPDPDPDPGPIKMKNLDPGPDRVRVWKDPQLSR
jgi:hypothetical protein